MNTLVTHSIKVSVEPYYLPHESQPMQQRFVFAYNITIENQSHFVVKLLRRHWHILESNGVRREVEGEGVVGMQPELAPGSSYQYTSWCPMMTDAGKMFGTFQMIRLETSDLFYVNIPEFSMFPPFKMN